MSAYISFYVKSNNHEFLPLATFSRSSEHFQAVENYAVYEKNIPFTSKMCSEIIDELDAKIHRYEEMKNTDKDMISQIGTWNNSVEDKMEEIYRCMSSIAEIEDEIVFVKSAKGFYTALYTIIEEAEDTKYFSNEERHINPDTYVWVGYESSYPAGKDGNSNANKENGGWE